MSAFTQLTLDVIPDKPRSSAAPGSILERQSLTMDPGTALRLPGMTRSGSVETPGALAESER
ncbi:hypothetical protein DWF00_16210 [Bosea caraganae]|uniref:Uncharacterized protein n=1 Tax=Bosea caraganae TaxID=2763117 RepID=A0A370L6E1_9HYPH|nr:hypothetical protein DWE98_11175 [Bosea caraganae]RDJ25921.1 hypothetical protein DWF00_16210 [Bosea caraganae]